MLDLSFLTNNWPHLQNYYRGWSGGAMVLGKPAQSGRRTNLDSSRARTYCACRRCEFSWGYLDIFSASVISFVALFLGDGPI